jgi:hypothetical protein
VSGNDVKGWIRDRDDLTYWSTFIPDHPMLLLWVVGLGLPLFATARARRGRPQARGAVPYPDDVRREGATPVRLDGGRRMAGRRS